MSELEEIVAKARAKICTGRRAFQTILQARQPGCFAYKCPYCQLYHRGPSLAKLAEEQKKARRRR